mmetsp:Transcript_24014/g.78169  ORF Transcript_24014/g.78169 Transcript_24014/m.78169 type:complete len:338 (-) Transcript_24014:1334-2347(-)
MRMTGMAQNISLGRDSSSTPALSSQRAPSMVSPVMKAPSREGASICSTCFLVTSVSTTVLSSGQSLRRAVVCMTAVRNDCGLKSPESHTTLGSERSPVHSVSWLTRWRRLRIQDPSGRRLGYASFSHPGLTRSLASAFMRFSIGSLMVRSPLSPRSSSASERLISARSLFMRSVSWIATMMYGVTSSARPRTSSSSNWSGSFSTSSSSTIFALSSTDIPSSPPLSRGWSERMALQSDSASRSLKPISAFGWSPNASGVSVGNVSPMYSIVCARLSVVGGLENLGKNSIPSMSSSFRYDSRYMNARRRSQSSTTWPPYMISPIKYLRSSHGTLELFST